MRLDHKRVRVPLILAVCAAVLRFMPATAEPVGASPTPPDALATPALTSALTAAWWQWALSIPSSVHPLRLNPNTPAGGIDPSSAFCMVGQHGPAWFLGGYFRVIDVSPAAKAAQVPKADVTRTCEVPLDTPILIPVLNVECSTAEEVALGNLDPDATLAEKTAYLRACATGLADEITTANALFGGRGAALTKLAVKRVRTDRPFSVSFPPDNILGLAAPAPNPSLASADGYWAVVRPDKPGTYELITFGAAPAFDFELRIRYILTIVPPRAQ